MCLLQAHIANNGRSLISEREREDEMKRREVSLIRPTRHILPIAAEGKSNRGMWNCIPSIPSPCPLSDSLFFRRIPCEFVPLQCNNEESTFANALGGLPTLPNLNVLSREELPSPKDEWARSVSVWGPQFQKLNQENCSRSPGRSWNSAQEGGNAQRAHWRTSHFP